MNNPEVKFRVVEIIKVTPELAKEFLGRNYAGQRIVKNPKVKEFARDMKEGRWDENIWNPIRFTTDGTLIDGQYRLNAVIESGCTIWMGIQRNLSTEDFKFIDLGSKRTASDFLRSEKNRKNLAAVARMAYATKHGDSSLSGVIHGYISTSPREYVSNPCITNEAENALVKEASDTGCRIRSVLKCGASSIYGFGVWLLKWLSAPNFLEEDVEGYVNDLVSITPTQSTAVIVSWLKNSIISGKKVTIDDQLALFLYGYECYIAKRDLKVYQPKNGALKKYDGLIKEARNTISLDKAEKEGNKNND